MYRLLFLNGQYQGKRITVQQSTLMIGRGSDCHVDLSDDDRVSHHHAVIEIRGGQPVIRDLGAMNKIEVNQKPVVEHRLMHGDRIEVGGTQIEFITAEARRPPHQRRRFSKMQAFSLFGIVLVVLLQVGFVVLFPLWQKNETVPAPMPPPEKKVVVVKPDPAPEPELTPVPAPTPTPATSTEVPAQPEGSVLPETPAPAPVPVPDPVPVPPPAPAPAPEPELVIPADPVPPTVFSDDPLLAEARQMIADAKALAREENYTSADNLLHRAQMLAPDHVEAWQERAKLYEKRELYDQASAQWREVMRLAGEGTPDYEKASAAKKRMDARIKPVEPVPANEPSVLSASASEPVAASEAGERRIRIASVDRERFRSAEEYDEMRMLRVSLRPATVESVIDTRQLRVTVEFFDRVDGSTTIVPTRALVQDEGLEVTDTWLAGEARTLTATYVLPKGFREREFAELGQHRTYEGHRVTVTYQGRLQDQQALPRRLLDLP